MNETYDAVIVGAGPNGLAAAVELARRERRVVVLEGASTIGGGARTEELLLPGHRHDVCSAVHPLAVASPFLRSLALERHGLEWVHADLPLAHPLGDGSSVALHRSVAETAAHLAGDGPAYRRLVDPLVNGAERLLGDVLGPIPHLPRHPLLLGRFGTVAVRSVSRLARRFDLPEARALLGGLAAHSILPLDRPFTSAVGLVLAVAGHVYGWPLARGGSAAIADALAAELKAHGGEIVTGTWVNHWRDLPDHRVAVFDLMPGALADLAGDRIVPRRRAKLRSWRHGPGSFKVDFVLDGPVPWRDPLSARAATVHLGGPFEEMAASEESVWRGALSDTPFVLVAQPSTFDTTRAPAGRHIVWAYCHVPAGWSGDATDTIERRIERFAPGFRDRIVARSSLGPPELERRNPNLVGGDITGGVASWSQLLARPLPSPDPYRIAPGIYLCSSATPPGAGVHGMSGYHAARSALRHELA